MPKPTAERQGTGLSKPAARGAGLSKLSVYEFGRQLLATNDLDPVYVVLWNAGLEEQKLQRWLVAYWCFYHCGTASWIVDQAEYWKAMTTAAGSKDWPRSSERRHFRGQQALKSVAYLRSRGTAGLFADLLEAGPTAANVIEAVQQWRGFGPWISFKVADMLDRLAIRTVEFEMETVMYDSPQKAADLLWELERKTKPVNSGPWAIEKILHTLNPIKAPPRYERLINAQEAETILCKWKSYMTGHYHIGEDIQAVKTGLMKFGKCKTSQRLLKAGKVGGLW